MGDTKKEVKIPNPPDQLNEEALGIYNELYQLLIEEGRGDDKYKYSVAIAANSLYFYKLAMDNIKIIPEMGINDVGAAIRALNSASSEWSKASRALLLTPQAELQIKEGVNIDDAAAPPTLSELMGEMLKTKSKNDNYSKRRAQPKMATAKAAATKRRGK